MAEVQSLISCCKIHKRQMRSSNKKGAEDKYFGLFTPQKDNKYNIKKTVYSFFIMVIRTDRTTRTQETDRTAKTGKSERTDWTDRFDI